jgi:hypothetical protein
MASQITRRANIYGLGMRLTNTRPRLYAGYARPDHIVFNADVAKSAGQGIKLAGFFGPNSGIASGEFLIFIDL